jgi:hypothetical protein
VTDNINVSYSFQIGQSTDSGSPTVPPGAHNPAYAYADCEQIAISESMVMIMNLRNRKKMVVTREVANALAHCSNFETLPAHAAMLCSTIGMLRDQQADVLQVLESARSAGVLVGADETAARLSREPLDMSLAPTRVFIITCDRPAAIERLLDSLQTTGNLGQHEQLCLIDDSRQPDNALQNRQLVKKFNISSVKQMLYFGSDAAAALLSELVAALPAQERGLRFLLDRVHWADQPTYGLSRNFSLMLSVGYRALVLDDDILCRVVPPPVGTWGVGFCTTESREAWFYPSGPEMMQQIEACEHDPLSRQAEALGKPLAAVLGLLHGGELRPADLEHCNANMLGVLTGESPVLVTQCGSAGDPGTPGSRWLARLDDESVERLLQNNGDRNVVPEGRPCWLGHTRPTFSLRGVMSQLTGLDNRRLLPPYVPILRGEDDLFASMLVYLYPQSAVLNCAWAVPHLPIEERSGSGSATPAVPRLSLGTLASYLREKIDTRACASVDARLAALAAEFRGLGECSAEALLNRCEYELTKDCAAGTKALESRLAKFRAHAHPGWQAFLARLMSQAQTALGSASVFENGRPPGWLGAAQDAAIAFSEVLESWQAIRDCSVGIVADMVDSQSLLP